MISPKSASVNDLTNIMSGQDVKTFFWVFFSKQRHLGPVKMKNAKEEEKRSEKEKKSCLHDIKNESRPIPGWASPRPADRRLYPQKRQRLSSDIKIQLGSKVEPGMIWLVCRKKVWKGTFRLVKGQHLPPLAAGQIPVCSFLQHPHAGPWKPCEEEKFYVFALFGFW